MSADFMVTDGRVWIDARAVYDTAVARNETETDDYQYTANVIIQQFFRAILDTVEGKNANAS
jgi:hypothetical protein